MAKGLVLAVVAVIAGSCFGGVDMNELDQRTFRQPPAEFRSITFWSLNDELESAEIERQLELFKAGGFGGTYLHSRIGLLTEYLGDDWWVAMDAGVRASEQLGLEAWFYDEDKWPSGFAGGIVPKASEEFHSRSLLRMEKGTPVPTGSEVICQDEKYQYICYKVQMGNPWYNGTCWVDLLNPATVDAFIDCTYKPYAQRYADRIGGAVKGIFTDEPQISPRDITVDNFGSVPYSPIVREDFKKQWGYDFVDEIAGLFEDVGDFRKVRLHYWRTVAKRFEKSFSERIGQYCAEHGMIWTGHYNAEEYLMPVMRNVGNMAAHYRHMQQPGIDHLGLRTSFGVIPAKRLSSVANQYGKQRRLSELFGTSGQDMSFEDRKWIGDWHCVMGINHFCPHLSLYSLKGCRKRDFPPTFSYHQPWWQYNKLIEDHMARMCYATAVGQYAADVLLISPLESAYMETQNYRVGWACRRGRAYIAVVEELLRGHRGYDIGDEQIIEDVGKVDGRRFVVGQMQYGVVVLPFMSTIRAGTVEKLLEFAAAGGKILAAGYLPEYIDGEQGGIKLEQLTKVCEVVEQEELLTSLGRALPPSVRIEGDAGGNVWINERVVGGGRMLVLGNMSRLEQVDCRVYLSDEWGQLILMDPATGRCMELEREPNGAVSLHFARTQSWIIAADEAAEGFETVAKYSVPGVERQIVELTGAWQGRRLDLNAMTLDFARYSVDGGETFSKPEPVLGIYQRFEQQGWSGRLVLCYDFDVEKVPGRCAVAVEQPDMYEEISVNGELLEFGDEFYLDQCMKTAAIAQHLQPGKNTVRLELDFVAPVPDSFDARKRYGSEIESIYLAGDFGVKAIKSDKKPARTQWNKNSDLPSKGIHRFSGFAITGEKGQFEGDLVLQGYPFYAGRFELSKEFEIGEIVAGNRYLVKFDSTAAIVVDVDVNGHKMPAAAWSPWEIDITEALQQGKNEIKVVLTNSLRNLLGPHHHRDGELTSVGADSFGGRTTWTGGGRGDFDWYEVRLEKEPRIWRDDYYHIPFGLAKVVKVVSR